MLLLSRRTVSSWRDLLEAGFDLQHPADEIADFRTELNDLLWDFDSVIEVDDFDAAEYSKLRALSSKAAKRIYEILMRLKLERPPIAFGSFDSAGISRATSAAGHSHVSDTLVPPSDTPQTVDEETLQPQGSAGDTSSVSLMAAQAGPDLGYEGADPEPARDERDVDSREKRGPPTPESPVIPHQLFAKSVRHEDIPAAPLENPWQPAARPPVTVAADQADLAPPPDRRRRVSSEDSDRPFTPPFVVSNAFGEPNGSQPRPRRLDDGVAALVREEMTREGNRAGQNTASSLTGPVSNGDQGPMTRDMPSPSQTNALPSPPFSTANISSPPRSPRAGFVTAVARPIKQPMASHRDSQASSTNSGRSSMFDPGARDSMVSPVTDRSGSRNDDYNLSPGRKDSYAPIPEDRPVMSAGWSSIATNSLPVRHGASPPTQTVISPLRRPQQVAQSQLTEQPSGTPGLIVAQNTEEQPGLEPVLRGNGSAPGSDGGPPVVLREPNCSITVDSSFYQLKGFCDGAKDIIRGGVGVKKVRKVVGSPTHPPSFPTGEIRRSLPDQQLTCSG